MSSLHVFINVCLQALFFINNNAPISVFPQRGAAEIRWGLD